MLGVMDHDDEVLVHDAIQIVSQKQDSLQDIVNLEFHLIQSNNKHVQLLHKNQELIMENLMNLKKEFAKNNVDISSSLHKAIEV